MKFRGLKTYSSVASVFRFTLVELLVVIAIIATLAGMLLPALDQALMSAKCIRDQAHLKQIQQSWIMYSNDFDGRSVPFAGAPANMVNPGQEWTYKLSAYFNDWNVILNSVDGVDPLGLSSVPEEISENCRVNGVVDPSYMVELIGRAVFPAYGYNYQGWMRSGSSVSIAVCGAPSKTIVFGSTLGSGAMMGGSPEEERGFYKIEPYHEIGTGTVLWAGAPPLVQNSYGCLSTRLLGKANIGFADGHTEACYPSDLTEDELWNPLN